MAEFLAVVGGVSSFLAIAEFCCGLVDKVTDIKNAPQDVQELVREIQVVGNSARKIHDLIRDTEDAELKLKIDEAVKDALDHCTSLTSTLQDTLANSQEKFKHGRPRSWWERLRIVYGKKGIKKFQNEIERAKLTLLMAQHTASDIACASHQRSQHENLATIHRTMEHIHTNGIERSATIERKMDESVETVGEMMTIAERAEQKLSDIHTRQAETTQTHIETKEQLNQISHSQRQGFSKVSKSISAVHETSRSISAKVEAGLEQGQELLTVTSTIKNSVTDFQSGQKYDSELLQSIKRGVDGLIALHGNPAAMAGLVTQALVQREKCQENKLDIIELQKSVCVPTSTSLDTSPSKPSASPLIRRQRWKDVSNTSYVRNRWVSIDCSTRKEIIDDGDTENDSRSAVKTETCITVRSRLGFVTGDVSYAGERFGWDPLFENKVRFIRIFSEDSAIWKACEALDLAEIRRLFISGEASPFMESVRGWNLLEIFLQDWSNPFKRFKKPRWSEIENVFDFLVEAHGRRGIRVHPHGMAIVLRSVSYIEKSEQERLLCYDRMVRKILKGSTENPLNSDRISRMLDVDDAHNMVMTTVTRQDLWPLDLEPACIHHRVYEGPKQMLCDKSGNRLRELLDGDATAAYNPSTFPSPVDYIEDSPLMVLIFMGLLAEREDLKQCCINRLQILLTRPLREPCKLELGIIDDRDKNPECEKPPYDLGNPVAKFAIQNGVRNPMESILRDTGWGMFGIHDFFDRETYSCVPSFIDGGIAHVPARQVQREFMTSLCEGHLTKNSMESLGVLADELSWPVHYPHTVHKDERKALWKFILLRFISAANLAFTLRNTPGSWIEESKIRLVPEIDFPLDIDEKDALEWWCKRSFLWWHHHATEHEVDEECECKEWHDWDNEDNFWNRS